jgi:hypothetical protein
MVKSLVSIHNTTKRKSPITRWLISEGWKLDVNRMSTSDTHGIWEKQWKSVILSVVPWGTVDALSMPALFPVPLCLAALWPDQWGENAQRDAESPPGLWKYILTICEILLLRRNAWTPVYQFHSKQRDRVSSKRQNIRQADLSSRYLWMTLKKISNKVRILP